MNKIATDLMKKQLIELLNITAHSGNEKPVREYLQPILSELVDKVIVDDYGNLLGEKKIGSGQGAVVLLSAHMDTVKGVLSDKKLIEKDGKISASKGALGADDRAGIAIILEVLRNLWRIKGFNGTIKVAFSRQEEIGCVGAGKIDPNWYKDVNLAIVVDRRGNRDIVVGCGKAFCSDAVGKFMEEVSALADMNWQCVEGGISDAMVFSKNGINSVNVSAGYYNEHTSQEYVVLAEMMDTMRLILQAIAVINDFYSNFGEVPYENQWVKSWYKKSKKSSGYGYDYYFEDSFMSSQDKDYQDYIWAMELDADYGDVWVYETIDNNILIQQGDNEIILSRQGLKSLINQLKSQL